MSETTERDGTSDRAPEDLSVEELAELEAGTAGTLSPLLLRADVVASAIICVAATALAVFMPDLVISGGIYIARDYQAMSPSLIPRLAFGGLAVVAAVSTVGAYRRFRTVTGTPRDDELDGFRRASIALVIIVFYAATVSWLGFILSTMIVAATTAYFLGLRNPLAFIPMVLIVPITVRFVFERLLLIALPRSRIETIGHLEDVLMRALVDLFLS